MLLYEHPLSSYARKVKIALREKIAVVLAGLRDRNIRFPWQEGA